METINKIKRLKKPNAPWKKFYNKKERDIKVQNKTIYEYFEDSAIKHSNLTALEYFGKKISYTKLLNMINEVAASLKKYKIKTNDVVTICSANIPEAVICFYAINKIGAIANMIHPLSAEEEIKNYLINNHAKFLIAIDVCFEKINNIINYTKVEKTVIVSAANYMPLHLKAGYKLTTRKKIKLPRRKDERYISWKRFYKKTKETVIANKKGMDSPAVILHSGGTTGSPKGIVLSNKCFNALTEQSKFIFKKVTPGDSVLTILPLFHGFGLGVCTNTPLCFGAKVILVPQFNSRKFDILINKTKPNLIMGVPTLYEALVNSHNVKNLDLSYLKYVISGGDILSTSLNNKINNYLKQHGSNETICQGYGMTEALAAVTLSFGKANKEGSIGIPFPGNYFKIVNPETGDAVKPFEDGEICISGPTVMMGYLDNEVATNDILRIHNDGYLWLHTGDIGYMDNNGIFYYKQRLKRMIVSSGYNVYPSYIENIIIQHPAVLNCTVIGIPHSYKVEVPKAFIVLKNDYIGINPKGSIKRFCEKHLSKHSIPYEFEFRKSLPKTLIGKIDYRKLMEEEKRKHHDV